MDPVDEDTVQCLVYSCESVRDILTNKQFWASLCDELNKTISILTQEYIWHRDEFKLNVPLIDLEHSHGDTPPYLISTTCFGDNIEDEWFILYLVLEITKSYDNVIVQIKDNDGDFMLIEAADYLPQWANPDNTLNRVFVYKGHIYLIPPELANLEKKLSITDALNIIIQVPERTRLPLEIENVVLERIGNYPHKIKENTHQAVINIPADLAALLTLEPSLIAPIATTYCGHDPFEAKLCRNIPLNDCIEAKVKFTKCLYSMLAHSKLLNNVYLKKNNTKGTVIGLKLTFGFHMILKSGKDLFSTKEFSNFLVSLKNKGYFKGNIEGSKEYNELLKTAKKYFSSNVCPVKLLVYNRIKEVMSTDEFRTLKETLVADKANSNLIGDSDDWLNIHPDHLNDLLSKRYGKQLKFQNNDIITTQTITDQLNNFLNKCSDFEGIETDNNEKNNSDIEFEPDKFTECLEKFLNLVDPSNNEESDVESDISDNKDESVYSEDELDKEIYSKLSLESNFGKNENVLHNILQSIKEENSSSGPSSTLLRSIGIHKKDLLDSDDDEQ